VKLWFSTANGLQRSRCSKIGSPSWVKNAGIGYKLANNQSDIQKIAKYHAIKSISLKINEGVSSFHE